jgi:hypothetical protein
MATVNFRLRSDANNNVSIKVRITLGRDKADLELNTVDHQKFKQDLSRI